MEKDAEPETVVLLADDIVACCVSELAAVVEALALKLLLLDSEGVCV